MVNRSGLYAISILERRFYPKSQHRIFLVSTTWKKITIPTLAIIIYPLPTTLNFVSTLAVGIVTGVKLNYKTVKIGLKKTPQQQVKLATTPNFFNKRNFRLVGSIKVSKFAPNFKGVAKLLKIK